ncbi:hypothetical protein [Corynebacterium sputi]|nr:hypothetical protein [Corynebacterium sputi]
MGIGIFQIVVIVGAIALVLVIPAILLGIYLELRKRNRHDGK